MVIKRGNWCFNAHFFAHLFQKTNLNKKLLSHNGGVYTIEMEK